MPYAPGARIAHTHTRTASAKQTETRSDFRVSLRTRRTACNDSFAVLVVAVFRTQLSVQFSKSLWAGWEVSGNWRRQQMSTTPYLLMPRG